MPNRVDDFDFQDTPQQGDSGFPWTVKRTPPAANLDMVLLSDRHVGVRTHYFHGRTIGHRKYNCPACEIGNLSRWSGYILAMSVPDGSKILFEFTPTAALFLLPLYEKHNSLRGLKVRAFREAKRANGSITLSFRGFMEHLSILPDAVPIHPLLFRIWGVSADTPDTGPNLDAPLSEHERVVARPRGGRRKVAAPEDVPDIVRDLAGQLTIPGISANGNK